jgi:hypothetical protein
LTIFEFLDQYKTEETDTNVLKAINNYYSNNVDALMDGIVKDYVIFGATNRQKILDCYNIPEEDFKKFKKTNKVLQMDAKISGNIFNLCLLKSYYDTDTKIFLDFMGLVFYGARFSQYFKHGTNSAKMKYIIDSVLTGKSLFKKHGCAYLVIEDSLNTIVNTPKLKPKFDRMNDQDVVDIINRIYTSVNDIVKNISRVYYTTKDESNNILLQKDIVTDEGQRISMTNNSVIIDNLLSMVENYHPSALDQQVLKTLRINSPVKKGVFNHVLLNHEAKVFYLICQMYILYYTSKYSSSFEDMKKEFIPKCMTARMADKNMYALEKQLFDVIKDYCTKYAEKGGDIEDLRTNAGVVKIVKYIKDYCIIKCRHLMNEL